MKTNTKRASALCAVLLFASVLFAGIGLLNAATATAETQTQNVGRTYYYEELKKSPMAQQFYGVMKSMAENGTFTDGKGEYDLVGKGVLTESDVAAYVDGNSPKIPVAFGAARDAFYMDNPDLFYIDVYKLYLSAGMQNGKYVAFVSTGTAESYYTDNAFSSVAEVEKAIQDYETAINKIVADAKAAGADPVTQIEFANAAIAEKTEYDYGARQDGLSGEVIQDGNVNTAYGSLVNGKALCGGYSRAFKAVMDRLDIPCVLVQGNGYSGVSSEGDEAGYIAHMWNAVQVGGLWYGVDVTWNDSSKNLKKYLLGGEELFSVGHFEDGVISSSGFKLKYPALRPLNYGVNEDKSGFVFKDEGTIGTVEFGYKEVDVGGDKSTNLTLGVSYEGKNFLQLEEEGKYLAVRTCGEDGVWGVWTGIAAWYHGEGGFGYIDEYSIQPHYPSTFRIQQGIFDCNPDGIFYSYLPKTAEEHVVVISSAYTNDGFGTYKPAPHVKTKIPYELGSIKSFKPMDIKLVYSEKLVPIEGKTHADVSVKVYASHNDIEKYVTIENVVWNPDENSISFTFTPSKYYAHNCEMYDFAPTNVVGENSGKAPEPGGGYTFKMKQVVCSKVFNDGRLYLQVFGQPQFVGAEDMSLTEFKDQNGQPVAGDQRSQLMLVVNEPSKAENKVMEDKLLESSEIDINKEDIKASSTYQIDLQLCGVVRQVPKGSYMQVGFGFPEGYGPEDAGVTFTVYHYTRKPDGTIDTVEEIPCVVSEYGIIATVKSFSPFMICAVDSSKVKASKNVYASVDGVGGKLDRTVIETVTESGVSYTVTPDSGYKVNRVLINGAERDMAAGGGELKIAYSDLKDGGNIVEVSFISERVANDCTQRGIVLAQPKIIVTEADMIEAAGHEIVTASPAKKSKAGLIVGIIIAVVVVAAGACVAVYFVMKKKNGNSGNGGKGGSQTKKRTATTTRTATATRSNRA